MEMVEAEMESACRTVTELTSLRRCNAGKQQLLNRGRFQNVIGHLWSHDWEIPGQNRQNIGSETGCC